MDMVLSWENIRPLADLAIRKGMKCSEFLAENDIPLGTWHRYRPKGYNWSSIQKNLKITVKRDKISKEEEEKEIRVNTAPAFSHYLQNCFKRDCPRKVPISSKMCEKCQIDLLKHISDLNYKGFVTEHNIMKFYAYILSNMEENTSQEEDKP